MPREPYIFLRYSSVCQNFAHGQYYGNKGLGFTNLAFCTLLYDLILSHTVIFKSFVKYLRWNVLLSHFTKRCSSFIHFTFHKTQKEAVLKKYFIRLLTINDKKRILVLLKILDKIQQDNEDARNGIEKSISTICKEEGISFEQVFYVLFFDAHLSAFRVESLF